MDSKYLIVSNVVGGDVRYVISKPTYQLTKTCREKEGAKYSGDIDHPQHSSWGHCQVEILGPPGDAKHEEQEVDEHNAGGGKAEGEENCTGKDVDDEVLYKWGDIQRRVGRCQTSEQSS